LVIVDLPVIAQAGLGLFFASQADGTILILDGKTTKTRQAKAVVELMKENQVPVVGAILNKHIVTLPRWLARWF
jgi:Mrp family chromosome partitioning ATPase